MVLILDVRPLVMATSKLNTKNDMFDEEQKIINFSLQRLVGGQQTWSSSKGTFEPCKECLSYF